MVCLLAAPWVQLSIGVGNGWPHNALRHHWLMPIICHFRDCKALLVTSLTHVSGAITSVQTFTFTLPLICKNVSVGTLSSPSLSFHLLSLYSPSVSSPFPPPQLYTLPHSVPPRREVAHPILLGCLGRAVSSPETSWAEPRPQNAFWAYREPKKRVWWQRVLFLRGEKCCNWSESVLDNISKFVAP